jgi:hypothetical protein
MDKVLIDIADQVPGFGGMFLDKNGDLVIYVLDLGNRASAESAAIAFLESLDPRERPTIGKIRVQQGDYDFRDLIRWRDSATDVLNIPGVVFTDADEGTNRFRVGVDNPTVAESVIQVASAFGVPAEAVLVEDVGPVRTLSTLQDSVRPVEGGLKITSTKFCTLGFVAKRNQSYVFITNSHCTDTQGGTEGTVFAQPDATGEDIGLELVDPAYTAITGCSPSTQCRKSDSAAIVFYQGVDYEYGHIYRTESFGASSGSITIDGTFPIEAEATVAMQGDTLNKMGMSTGWTRGPVTGTCVRAQQDTGYDILCETLVGAGAGGGDSGAAVFAWDPANEFVILHGIVHSGGSNQFIFSPITDIEAELGSLVTQTLE